MEQELDYHAYPLDVEHYREIQNLLEDYRELFYSNHLRGSVDYIIRLDRITEQLEMVIETKLENK